MTTLPCSKPIPTMKSKFQCWGRNDIPPWQRLMISSVATYFGSGGDCRAPVRTAMQRRLGRARFFRDTSFRTRKAILELSTTLKLWNVLPTKMTTKRWKRKKYNQSAKRHLKKYCWAFPAEFSNSWTSPTAAITPNRGPFVIRCSYPTPLSPRLGRHLGTTLRPAAPTPAVPPPTMVSSTLVPKIRISDLGDVPKSCWASPFLKAQAIFFFNGGFGP
mmetsp:Transcript_20084/g.55465  ORF Transcript_20084/g.55465 Transcript_20084/m.55465 type:complete len:217 (+) Transcript_20084:1066-1716(+)